MIIYIESSATNHLAPAKDSLQELVDSWGFTLHEVPATALGTSDSTREDDKSVDPVALAALVLSIPSAALAVTDLADRIHKRRRAKDIIDKARQIADDHSVTLKLDTQDGPQDLSTLDPDQLLDLPESDDPA
ncbi:hypothetical protein GCM10022243_13570 [Saccharothrix violaceirubra]|uniref:Uncharacterized protein n=1 Tax=Saccharothrix violaceirubra TaxID=413306 RepID=A0A7W7SYX6_9PSEU|nr:hypothetical protein [Saccharothrix violaceirubra]MBB4963523.1 hypothetical protein [Saccharothrix violaceirubra]